MIDVFLFVSTLTFPDPDEQFRQYPQKTCQQLLGEVQLECDSNQSVHKCHERIDVYYLKCGGKNGTTNY